AGLYGLLWSMLSQWVFRINPDHFMSNLAWTLACGYVSWLLTFVFEPMLLHWHNARQVDLRAVRPR
ncbi:MAG: hypothetical protein ACLVB4_08025, partial [Butyricicoccus sp.]